MRRRTQASQRRSQLPRAGPRLPALLYAQDGPAAAGRAGQHSAGASAAIGSNAAGPVPQLAESFPTDSPHLAKARLLANAGLNDYIAQEIAADPDSASWERAGRGADLRSYGEAYRAMAFSQEGSAYAATSSIKSIRWPIAHLFPEPWWETIKAESAKTTWTHTWWPR